MAAVLDIVIPFWGDPQYLYAAVDSVLAQTSDQWRLTVVNDHDPNPGVTEHFEALDDPRIRYFYNERNLGVIGNFRYSLTLTQAEYVVMMGSDDLLEPTYVATVLRAGRRYPQADIIQPGVRVIDSQGLPTRPLGDRVKARLRPSPGHERLLEGENLAASLLAGNWLYWPSLAMRAETLAGVDFRDEFPTDLDLGLILDIVRRGGHLLTIPDVVFDYRRHQSSASSQTLADGSRFREDRRFFALQNDLMRQQGWMRAARASRVRVSSRLHAASLVPVALKDRDWDTLRQTAVHLVVLPTQPMDDLRSAVPLPDVPRVSVCMATWNGERFVGEQIDSILEQLGPSDELVIVDDASTDGTVAEIEAVDDDRIRLLARQHNRGYVATFQEAMREAHGEFILLSDQDDVWLPGRVNAMVDALADHDVVASNLTTLGTSETLRGPLGQRDWRLHSWSSGCRLLNVVGILAGMMPYYGCAMGVRRSALSNGAVPFPEFLDESHDLWLALYGNIVGSMAHLDDRTTARRLHESNQTPSTPRGLRPAVRSRLMLMRCIRVLMARRG